MAALLDRCQLVLEVDARRTRLDHRFHKLEGIEHATEARFRVGDNRREVVDAAGAFHVLDLVRAHEGIVDALHHRRHRIDRIQRLIRVHLASNVSVRSHLPSGEINRLEAGLHLLHRLVATHGAERVDKRLIGDELP